MAQHEKLTANFEEVLTCIWEYVQVATQYEYWEGIYRRVLSNAPMTYDEIYSINNLVREWTQYHHFDYRTTALV